MRLAALVSRPYFRKHKLRSVLTVAGIVLGVAVFVALHTANQAVFGAFEKTVERIAGSTQLQVSAGEAGFPEEALERVQARKEVRAAAPVIEAVVETGLAGQGSLLVLAVDMTGDASLRDYSLESGDDVIDDPLVFLAQPDSLIVTRDFAARNGLQVNSRLALKTMAGAKQFTIRGLMKPGGLASAYGNNLAIMDIYSAQVHFGRGRRFDRIDVGCKPELTVESCRAALQSALGPGFDVEPPGSRVQQFEALLKVYRDVVNLSSWFALFIGMFIIYNSFSIAVTQRRSEIGILRALGATQGQIRRLFLWESALAGLLGSALGIAAGYLVARALAGYISVLLGDIFGVTGRPESVGLSPALFGSSLLLGVATSMAAALVPARAAARVDPVKALQKGAYQQISSFEARVRLQLAAAAAGAGAALIAFGSGFALYYLGYILITLATILLTPFGAVWIVRILRPALKWARPVEGALAADSLLASPRRTSATVAALMLSLGMAVALGGVARAGYASIADWANATLNPDLFVTASEKIVDRNFHFPAEMRDSLQSMEGVDEAQPVRSFTTQIGGTPVVLIALDMLRVAARTGQRRAVAGDYIGMSRAAAEGRGLLISENLAQLQGLSLGSPVTVPSPGGPLTLPVAGILTDYSGQQGTLLIDRSVYLRYWKDSSADIFRIYLKPGVDPAEAKQRILARFAGERRIFVLFNKEVKDYIFKLTDQWFGMTYIQMAIAVLVAVLGIVNTMTVSIADRRCELGILRAVGAFNRQVRHTIWMEAAVVGVIGLILGFATGALHLHYQLEMTRRSISGLPFDFTYPWTMAAALTPIIVGVAWMAAIGPAEAAVRGSLVEALEYE